MTVPPEGHWHHRGKILRSERLSGQNVRIYQCRFEDCVVELSDLPGYPKYPDAPSSPDPWAEPSERKEGPDVRTV